MFGLGKKKQDPVDNKKEKEKDDGGTIEVWTNREIKLTHNELIEYYCIKMIKPDHNHGQWLVSELAKHEQSKNPSFHGFPRIYRCKFKPLQFRHKNIIMNPETHPSYKQFIQDELNAKAEESARIEEEKLAAANPSRANSPSRNTRNASPKRSTRNGRSKSPSKKNDKKDEQSMVTPIKDNKNANEVKEEKKSYDLSNITNTNFAIWSIIVKIYNEHRLHLLQLYPPEIDEL
jgi:hypothetical protein